MQHFALSYRHLHRGAPASLMCSTVWRGRSIETEIEKNWNRIEKVFKMRNCFCAALGMRKRQQVKGRKVENENMLKQFPHSQKAVSTVVGDNKKYGQASERSFYGLYYVQS